jgi:hypothetical protein
MAGQHGTPRKRRKVRVAAVVLVILALVAAGISWYALRDDSKPAAPFVKIGSNVWRGQNDSTDMQATPTKAEGLPYPSKLTSIITPVKITPAGKLTDKSGAPTQATLRFKLNRKVDPTKEPVYVATSETGAAPWQLIQPTISADGWYAQVTTTHLSAWDVLVANPADIAFDFAEGLYHGLIGTNESPEKPKCANPPNQASGYGASYTNKNTAYVCLNKEGNGAALYMVNRKSYPLTVWRTGNIRVTDKGKTNAKWLNLIPTPGKNKFILWPGDKARFEFAFTPGDSGRVNTEFSGYAQSLYRLDVGLSSLFTILDRFGIERPSTHSDKYMEYMKKMLQGRECANAVFNEKDAGAAYAACFPKLAAGDPFGKIGTDIILNVVKFVNSLRVYIGSEISSLIDSVKHDDQFSVLVGRIRINPFKAIAGTWYIGATNVSTLKIASNGLATLTVNAGACNPDDLNSPMCNSITNITFASSGGRFTGTYGKTVYRTWDGDTWPATPNMLTFTVGRTFTLWVDKANVLKTSAAGPGNPLACRKGSAATSVVCGQ